VLALSFKVDECKPLICGLLVKGDFGGVKQELGPAAEARAYTPPLLS
jgi:hypothetical protein